MARTLKATPAAKNDAVKTGPEITEDAGKVVTANAADTEATEAATIPASEETGGDGATAVSPQASPEPTTENSDGGSNGAEAAPAATVEGIAPADAPKAVAPELVTADSPEAYEPDEDDDDPARVICRVRAVGGPRRRAGFAFDTTPRQLTRDDLGGTNEKISATLHILAADPRLSLLPPTD
jgi:hypothetical protein